MNLIFVALEVVRNQLLKLLSNLLPYRKEPEITNPSFYKQKLVDSYYHWDLVQPHDDKFATGILDFIKNDLRGCRDVAKLLAAISVISHFALWPEPAGSHALDQLLVLLGYRYPRVRHQFPYI